MLRFSGVKMKVLAMLWSHTTEPRPAEIAAAMGKLGYRVTPRSVENHLAGETPRLETTVGYSELFGCTVYGLLADEEDKVVATS